MIFLLLIPGFFLVLAIVLGILGFVGAHRQTAFWGAAAFLLAGSGTTLDLFRGDSEWLGWVTFLSHYSTLFCLGQAFLTRKNLATPALAKAAFILPLLDMPVFGISVSPLAWNLLALLGAFVMTAAFVVRLIEDRPKSAIDKVALAVLGAGSLSYLVRMVMLLMASEDAPYSDFFGDFHNVVFHLMSAMFGFLSGIILLVMIGMDVVFEHARQSAIDPLTGLGNRRALDEAIDSEGQRKWRCGGVLVVDMDHFKAVNDRFGHPEGDRLLQAVARALYKRIGGCGHLCRMGGEEFVLLIEQQHRDRIEEIAAEAHDAVREVKLDGSLSGHRPTASVGFHSRNAGATLTEAIRFADQALYRAKSLGRDCVVGARHVKGVTVMTEPPARQVV